MQTLATLSRITKNGHVSTWYFVKDSSGYRAIGDCNGHDSIKRKDNLEQLRDMYRTWIGYGYKPVQTQEMQLDLALA